MNPGAPVTTGSLATLLPFAVANHVSILELSYQDWLVGFDPAYSGYTQSYQGVITTAALGQ